MSAEYARANLLEEPNGNFVVGEYPLPDPEPGTVLLKIELCGLCGTDVHTWHAPAEAVFGLEYPISLGHEVSAVIEFSISLRRIPISAFNLSMSTDRES